jgi:hypothetical protein
VSGGERERGRKKQKKKTKSFSSPVAHSREEEEEEEEECRLKRHCFVFLSFFVCGDPKIGNNKCPLFTILTEQRLVKSFA